MTSSNVLQSVDLLLKEFKRREEDGIYKARTGHRDANAPIHSPVEELDLRRRFGLTNFVSQTVSLIYRFRGIDWVDEQPTDGSAETSSGNNC